MNAVTIDADLLAEQLAGDEPPVVLDVRWQLGATDGEARHHEAHIPGALYIDLERDLAGPSTPARGRHPLPDREAFESVVRSWGIGPGSSVVAYDDNGNLAAARLWWLLRWAGFEDVLLLDGGLRAWRDAGRAMRSGLESRPTPGTFTVMPGQCATVDIDEVARVSGVLLDARAGERFRGEQEPIDPRAGHIPGAVSAPTTDNLDEFGRFLPAANLRDRFAELGATPGADVAVYCGSGVTAAHQIAALAIAGIDATLYPGSWSQWSSDPDREVAVGE